MPKLKAIKGKLYVVEGDKVLEPFDFRGNYDMKPVGREFVLYRKGQAKVESEISETEKELLAFYESDQYRRD